MRTKIEDEIINNIINTQRTVKLFWDMDGTFTSMDMHNLPHKLEQGFFYKKRPIITMLNIVKNFYNLGADTYIISFCGYNYQKFDKIKWLHKHCGFIKDENIIIIPRKEPDVKQAETKQALKAEYMKDYICEEKDIVYLIDDNESVLLGTKEKLPFVNIVSPMDFIY